MDIQTKKIKNLPNRQIERWTNIHIILNKQIKGLGDKQEYGQIDKQDYGQIDKQEY